MKVTFLAGVVVAALTALPLLAAEKELRCGDASSDPASAIKVCTRVIEAGGLERPALANAYESRGTEWARQGQHDRAIADFTKAIELDPKLSAAYVNRALSRSDKGESDLAITDYEAALKLSPNDTRAHAGRAFEWSVKGEYKRAVADYDDVIRLEPNAQRGYFGRGRMRFYAGDFTGAAADLERAHQIEPGTYSALWLFLARKRAGIAAEKTLGIDARTSGTGPWPAPVVGLYLGNSTPEEVQKAAVDLNVNRQRNQRCEANFYIGQWQLLRGSREQAASLLRDASAMCPSSFIEYEGAVAELRRLDSERPAQR